MNTILKKSNVADGMKKNASKTIVLLLLVALAFFILAVAFYLIFRNNSSQTGYFTLAVTCFTIFYHFGMRIAVGELVTVFLKGRTLPYDSAWFRAHKFEKPLYRLLKVKKWKTKLITAKPEQFDIKARGLEELLFFMTQAEIVHEIIALLSFLPVILTVWFGSLPAFLITSGIACLIDLVFVIVQRFNRPRIMKQLKKKQCF